MQMNITTQLDTTTLQQFLNKRRAADLTGPGRARPLFGLVTPFARGCFSLELDLHRGLQADVLDLLTGVHFPVVVNDFTAKGQAAERRPE